MSFDSIAGGKDKEDEHSDDDIEEVLESGIESPLDATHQSQIKDTVPDCVEDTQEDSESVKDTFGEPVSKIDQLPDYVKLYTSAAFREIDSSAFIDELRKAIDWAKNYGAGYVNKSLFVYKILHNRHYDSRSAFKVMNQLLKERKITIKKETHNGRLMDCLEIMSTDIVPANQ